MVSVPRPAVLAGATTAAAAAACALAHCMSWCRHNRAVVTLVVALMALVFWEGQPNAVYDIKDTVLAVEGIIMCALGLDLCLCVLVSVCHSLACVVALFD